MSSTQQSQDRVRDALRLFESKWPRPGLPDALEALYEVQDNVDIPSNWKLAWADGGILRKHAESPCVYFFFDSGGKLLYVGQTRILGKRMASHFDVKNSRWKGRVASIGLLPIPTECWFEILAIEAFMIQELSPPENNIGKNGIS